MSCGKCPDFSDQIEEKYKKFEWEKEPSKEQEPEKAPEPTEEKRPWWKKLKDRIDPAGIGGLLPQPGMGI
jgi:hypothetical protein